jgi:hypothetical protein
MEGVRPFGVFGILHSFQKRKLRSLNSIPDPTSPLASFLERFFIDFGTDLNHENPEDPDALELGVVRYVSIQLIMHFQTTPI